MVLRSRLTAPTSRQRSCKPDWDNTIHDLNPLKLSTAELNARIKALKSKDWFQPRSSPRSSSSSGCSRPGQKARATSTMHAPTKNCRVRKVSTTAALREKRRASPKKPIPLLCSSDDDFDEDIRRLESLQRQNARYPSLEGGEPVKYASFGNSTSISELQYVETKSWGKTVQTSASKRREIKRRVKVRVPRPVATRQMKSVQKLLEKQNAMVLQANHTFIQELQTHVRHQEKVIEELNEFRVSATKDLTNLLVLVQKMLTIQESQAPATNAPLLEKQEIEEVPLLPEKKTSIQDESKVQDDSKALNQANVAANGTPPKPREVPVYLKKRISAPPTRALFQPENAACSHKAENRSREMVETTARVAENKRRLSPTDIINTGKDDPTILDEDFDKRENPLFETEKQRNAPRGRHKKSRLQDHQFSSLASRPSSAQGTKQKTEETDKVSLRRPASGGGSKVAAVDTQARPGAGPTCLASKKSNLEQEKPGKRTVHQAAAAAAASEKQVHKPVSKKSTAATATAAAAAAASVAAAAPRFTLQGWSAAFLQPELRNHGRRSGKENNAHNKCSKSSSLVWTKA